MTRALVLTVAAATMLAISGAPAVANEHNQKSCEAAGGTWTNERGEKTCTIEETEVGNNERFECTTETTKSGRGNLGNKTEESTGEEEGTGTGSGKCPPGQFK